MRDHIDVTCVTVRIRPATTKGAAHGCRLDAKDVHWRGGVKDWSNLIRIHLIDGQNLYTSTTITKHNKGLKIEILIVPQSNQSARFP